MQGKRREVYGLLRRFPEHWNVISAQGTESVEFRSLCADYAAACTALKYWQETDDARGCKRSAEYRELIGELEKEALRYLGCVPVAKRVRPASQDD